MCGPFVIAHSIDILTPPPGLQRSLALPDGATPRGLSAAAAKRFDEAFSNAYNKPETEAVEKHY